MTLALLSETIKGLKGLRLAKFEDSLGTRDPVGAFAVNEMADDIEGTPSVLAFVRSEMVWGKLCSIMRLDSQRAILRTV